MHDPGIFHVWIDYGSQPEKKEMMSLQSSEMDPMTDSHFACVIDRPYQAQYDDPLGHVADEYGRGLGCSCNTKLPIPSTVSEIRTP